MVFLGDMNSFDFDDFNLEWLTRCAGGLLQEMVHNEKVDIILVGYMQKK